MIEIALLKELNSDFIMKLVEYQRVDSNLYLVCEFFDG